MNLKELTVVRNFTSDTYSIRTTKSSEPLSSSPLSNEPLENGNPVFFAMVMPNDGFLMEMDRAGAAGLLEKLDAFGEEASNGQRKIREALREGLKE